MRGLKINAAKGATFLALMCVYFYFAGRPAWDTLFGRKLAVWFGAGAVVALWVGGQRTGALEPVSLRPIFVLVGGVVMIAVFVLMLSTRDFAQQLQRRANLPAAGKAGIALLFAFVHDRPGLPEPGR
jgi:uncharacterized membrane protein YfcA